jgi:hypothetical protein
MAEDDAAEEAELKALKADMEATATEPEAD